jgi:hypothetical protein
LRGSGLRVFAVEDEAVQITWSRLPAGEVAVAAGRSTTAVDHEGGPGALTIRDLEPGRPHDIRVSGSAVGSEVVLETETLAPPAGRELYRFATMSDLHIGISGFGVFHRMRERGARARSKPHAETCASAACEELVAWGAQQLFVKGDITDRGHPDQWARAGRVFADLPIPHLMIPGNHDVRFAVDAIDPVVGADIADIQLVRDSTSVDRPGVRVVLLDSTTESRHEGGILAERADHAVDLLREATTGCVLLTHHSFQKSAITWYWPPGIPPGDGDPFLRSVGEACPATLVSSGHTHRHRRRQVGSVELTEVGSPKDFPGTWAGYVVHEGGIRQVVRRVEADRAICWNDYTKRAALGAWGRWSPGRLSDRCFVMPWS